MDIKTNLYPCDRGTGRLIGYHHFEASPNGVVVCRYCGKKSQPARGEGAAMDERHCKTCICGCTCGFGGEHVEDNPRCALTAKEADDE